MEHLRTYLLVFVTLNPSVWGQLDVIASIELTTADCLECDMTAFGRFGAMICSKSNEFGCCFTAYMKGMYLQNQTDTFNSFDNLLECFFFEVDNNDELSLKLYHDGTDGGQISKGVVKTAGGQIFTCTYPNQIVDNDNYVNPVECKKSLEPVPLFPLIEDDAFRDYWDF